MNEYVDRTNGYLMAPMTIKDRKKTSSFLVYLRKQAQEIENKWLFLLFVLVNVWLVQTVCADTDVCRSVQTIVSSGR